MDKDGGDAKEREYVFRLHRLVGRVYDWQNLIAGLLGLAGGVIAYVGVRIAAKRQVAAADRQVAAVHKQTEETVAARREVDERQLSVLKWAIRAEGRRLGAAVQALRGNALPSGPQPASRLPEQLIIQSSPLLSGERPEMALLDDRTRSLLEEVAGIVDEYNARIKTTNTANISRGPQIDQQILALIEQLAERTPVMSRLF